MTYGLEFLLAGKRGETRTARIFRGAILAIAAVILSAVFVFLTRRAMATSHWRATPCRITDSSVDVSADESEAPYTFSVTYEYSTPAGPGICSTYGNSPPRDRDAAEMYALQRKWPAGLSSTCYVNPTDRRQAKLVLPNVRLWQGLTAGVIAFSLILIVFYCIPQLVRPTPAPRQPRSIIELFYLALWVVACGIGLGWMSINPLARNESTARWLAVPCTVEHARLSFEQLRGELPLTLYRTDVLYRYTVAGVDYHSNRFSLTELASPFATGRRHRVAQFSAQSNLLCYVDPADPQQAVLSRRVSPTQWLGAWVAFLFLLGLFTLIPRSKRANLDALLRRSRRTIGTALVLMLVATIIGLVVMP